MKDENYASQQNPSGLLEPRGIDQVVRFAESMIERLEANDHKTGWEDTDANDLISMLMGEVTEVMGQVVEVLHLERHTSSGAWVSAADTRNEQAALIRECADVANFSMMIADNIGNLMDCSRSEIPAYLRVPQDPGTEPLDNDEEDSVSSYISRWYLARRELRARVYEAAGSRGIMDCSYNYPYHFTLRDLKGYLRYHPGLSEAVIGGTPEEVAGCIAREVMRERLIEQFDELDANMG